MPRFVFFGSSRLSVMVLEELLDQGFKPELIVTQPNKPVGRKRVLTPPPVKIWADENNIETLQPEKLSEIKEELSGGFDIFVLASYGKILPTWLLEAPEHGVLNVHPSLLPEYRGATPIQSAIIDGKNKTAVSIMLLDELMDHGPILAQKEVEIANLNYLQAEELLAREGGKILTKVIPEWISGDIEAVPQDHSKATYVEKFMSKDAFIDPSLMLKESAPEEVNLAERKVRALNPEPGTWTEIANQRIKILSAHIESNKLIPERIVPAGKKEMEWADFVRNI